MKTKPTQASVKELQGIGIQPDVIVCRSEHPLTTEIQRIKLLCSATFRQAMFCRTWTWSICMKLRLPWRKENLAQVVCESLHLPCPEPDLSDWTHMVEALRHPNKEVTIALVGKYIQLHDAYLSVVEALKHGGIASHANVHLKWVDSELVTEENVAEYLSDVDGVLVPGGFGNRGIEGMITAIRYARENKIPFLGLCLGMQLTIVEYARNVLGYHDAHSIEMNPNTMHPVDRTDAGSGWNRGYRRYVTSRRISMRPGRRIESTGAVR